MVITIASVVLNTGLGFALVLGCGPIPKLGVAGAGLATLVSQFLRCVVLTGALYHKEEVSWRWPIPSSKANATSTKLIKLTFPIAIVHTAPPKQNLPFSRSKGWHQSRT